LERRLAAILKADVAGYSRLIQTDELTTVETMNQYRTFMAAGVEARRGDVVNTAGDNFLAVFASVTDAVECAVQIQEKLARRNRDVDPDRKVQFRIGLHIGDIVSDGDDIYGDGINIAARIEALAPPGGICMSGTVHEQIRDRMDLTCVDLGRHQVKNNASPVRVFQMHGEGLGVPVTLIGKGTRFVPARRFVMALVVALVLILSGGLVVWFGSVGWLDRSVDEATVSGLPSIAVLPFKNLSGAPDQDYFADGISEDIITNLSKLSGLFVVARNSSFQFRDYAGELHEIAARLGVWHILNGSVRRTEDRIRITVGLVDSRDGEVIWAERYDRRADDIFAIQDEVAGQVVKELAVTLKAGEQGRLFRRHTSNFQAYDLLLQARRAYEPPSQAGVARAKDLLRQVIALDPQFAGGHAGMSFMLSLGVRHGFSDAAEADLQAALEMAEKAIDLDPDFGWSYTALGSARLMLGQHDRAIQAAENALRV